MSIFSKYIIMATMASCVILTNNALASCQQHFANGIVPQITNPSLSQKARELCFSEFGTLYSPVSRTPIYSASRLTKERIDLARGLPRTNSFHEEESLPSSDRSWLKDYSRSGFDRGHVAPNGDMSNPKSQDESFTLANMVPQVPENNRGIWAAIESSTRNLALTTGEIYIVTGPVFAGSNLRTVPSGRVLVPSHMFKAIYVPSTGETGVYLSTNDDSGTWSAISVNELTKMTSVDPFPSVRSGKDKSMSLPSPHTSNRYH